MWNLIITTFYLCNAPAICTTSIPGFETEELASAAAEKHTAAVKGKQQHISVMTSVVRVQTR